MGLSINEKGISCKLSKYLPQYIAKNMWGYVDAFLKKNGMEKDDVDFWAVHPGGRRIIEEAQNGLELTEEHTEALAKGDEGFSQGLAFSFSPGVGAEGILLK